jgi:lipoprotein-releasing system permease protein
MSPRSYAFFIARRYLAPNRRNRFINFITAIAILGVTFGTAALLISLTILEGFDHTLRSTMVAFMGHIEVTGFGNRPLEKSSETLRTISQRVPEVRAASPFIAREAIVRSRAGMEGIQLKGVLADRDVSQIRSKMVRGSFSFPRVDSTHLPGILLGMRLADRLHVTLGDTLVLFGPNGVPSPDNPPTIAQFVLGGIYRSGMAEYDDIYAYTSIDAARTLFQYGEDEVSGYDLLIDDIDHAEPVARKLDTALRYPHYPRTVFDIFQAIFAWLDLQRVPIPIVLVLIIVVAAFNIVSTLLMVVMEKTESIGVLSTLGSRPGDVMRIFVGQGLLIGGVGTALGSLLALTFTLVQLHFRPFGLDADIYFIDAVPVVLDGWHYIIVDSVSLLLCLLSTVIPARIAARLSPVDALRFR